MSMKNILTKELESVSLSKKEVLQLKCIADGFIKKLEERGLRAVIGGSMAKGTMIKKAGKQDVDIFVVFDYSEDILGLEKILKEMEFSLRDDPNGRGGKLKCIHGSRDYFHIIYDSVILEIVPVVKNLDPELAENVTDVSLSHVRYVTGEIKKNPELAGEIMLAKAFARAQRCYGAEGYVHGFSGYSLEILVIHFGGFIKFLKGIVKNRVIDPMKYFKGSIEIMRELNSNKLQGPLVVVDPTYKFRNACAGLKLSTFERFLEVSADFMKNPSSDFFKKKEINVEEMRNFAEKKKALFLDLDLSTDRQEGDIAGTKMKKFFIFFINELVRAGQIVLREEFDYSGEGRKAKGYLVVLEVKEIEVRGPSVGLEEASAAFRKANGDSAFKRKGFWWFKKKVSVKRVLEFVRGFDKEMGASINLV